MSDIKISIQETANETIIKFVSNSILINGGNHEFNNIDEAKDAPLVQQLFYLPFVKKVYITANFIAIQRYDIVEWEDVEEEVCEQIQEYLNSGKPIFKDNSVAKKNAIEVYAEVTPNPAVMKFVTNQAIKEFLPKSFTDYDKETYEFAANTLLADKHNSKRQITILQNQKELTVDLPYSDKTDYYPSNQLLSSRILKNNTGYIKINNSLVNNDLIETFDRKLDEFINIQALILDLRETPSGGNNTIAKAIMGRFIFNKKPYQRYRYVLDEKETGVKQIWVEQVITRKNI